MSKRIIRMTRIRMITGHFDLAIKIITRIFLPETIMLSEDVHNIKANKRVFADPDKGFKWLCDALEDGSAVIEYVCDGKWYNIYGNPAKKEIVTYNTPTAIWIELNSEQKKGWNTKSAHYLKLAKHPKMKITPFEEPLKSLQDKTIPALGIAGWPDGLPLTIHSHGKIQNIEMNQEGKFFIRPTIFCKAKGCNTPHITGTCTLTHKDGKWQTPAKFRPDDPQAKNDGKKWYCHQHSVKKLTVSDIPKGQSKEIDRERKRLERESIWPKLTGGTPAVTVDKTALILEELGKCMINIANILKKGGE